MYMKLAGHVECNMCDSRGQDHCFDLTEENGFRSADEPVDAFGYLKLRFSIQKRHAGGTSSDLPAVGCGSTLVSLERFAHTVCPEQHSVSL
jgi:hypothetical protein